MPNVLVREPATDEAHVYAPITYVGKGAEGQPDVREVYGKVSDARVDVDQQRCDEAWLKQALPEWFNTYANIREMHLPSAVGKGIELIEQDGTWFLHARISDANAIRKIDEGIYQSYSIGIKWPKLARDPGAAMGKICGGTIVEISLVDRPANDNKFVLVKAAVPDSDPDELESEKAAIPHKDGEPKRPPKGWPTEKSAYADPNNYSWRIDDKAHVRSAMAYYNGGKGKAPYSADEWAAVGNAIAAAASTFFGKHYSLKNGVIAGPDDAADAAKLAALTKQLAADLGKGEINADQVELAELLRLNELDDSQLFLVTANFLRYLMIRRLHEPSEPAQALSYFMADLGGMYDCLMRYSRNEADESWQEMSARIIAQLTTSHTVDRAVQDAVVGMQQAGAATATTDGHAHDKAALGGLDKVGRALSAQNLGYLQQAHDALVQATGGAVCGASDDGDEDDEMDSKALQAAITKSIQDAFARQPDSEALVKGAVAELSKQLCGLDERIRAVEERPTDDGPIIAAVQKAAQSSAVVQQRQRLEAELGRYRERAHNHSDPQVRAHAAQEASRIEHELKLLPV